MDNPFLFASFVMMQPINSVMNVVHVFRNQHYFITMTQNLDHFSLKRIHNWQSKAIDVKCWKIKTYLKNKQWSAVFSGNLEVKLIALNCLFECDLTSDCKKSVNSVHNKMTAKNEGPFGSKFCVMKGQFHTFAILS